MNPRTRQRVRELVRLLAPNDYKRLTETTIHESSFGYDPFGLERESAMLAFAMFKILYKSWFRVESTGLDNVPLEGPVLVTPNHSGVFPIDGVMLAVDLAAKMKKPRVMRAVVDNFACCLPFINIFFARCGQVIGARRNVCGLLEQGEMITLFPEGSRGTGKRYSERYRLRPFNVGFMEMSLKYRAPIVPAAVIGAEEQYPYMFNIKSLAKALHFPYLPVTPLFLLLGPLGLFPLPTRYYIRYGKPFHFYRRYPPEAVKDVETICDLVGRVRSRVQEMVDQGLRERKAVFGFSLPSLRKPLSFVQTAIGAGKRREEQGRRSPGSEARAKTGQAASASDATFPSAHGAVWIAPSTIEQAGIAGGPGLDWVQRKRPVCKGAGNQHLRWRPAKGIAALEGSERSKQEASPAP